MPSGKTIRYEYDASNPIGPARRFCNGALVAGFVWSGPLRLAACKDYGNQLEYAFSYNKEGVLDRVRISALRSGGGEKAAAAHKEAADTDWLGSLAAREKRRRLRDFLDQRTLPLELLCGCDQVGTPHILTDTRGNLVKETLRDSFGVRHSDSFPELFLPIGFAGGLEDPDTGLVRFGYRDYDPSVGRFTAPDPLGDTGGDHDLYDYCIDDPVTMNDPGGLFPPLLLFLGGKALAMGVAAAGAYGAAWVADKIKSTRDGKESTAAVDGMRTIAPLAGGAAAVSALPGIAATAPGAVTAAGRHAATAIHSSAHGDKIIKAAQFAEGFLNPNAPNAPMAPTLAGAAGTVAAELKRRVDKRKQ